MSESWQRRAADLATGMSTARALRDAPVAASDLARSHADAAAREAGLTGDLARLLADPLVTDVLINPDGSVVIERAGELATTGLAVPDTRALAVRLAAAAGRRLDDASPIVDGTIHSGVRLHAILPPLAYGGAAISLRVARHQAFDLAALAERGTLHPALTTALRTLLVRRANVVLTGATGTGKTTLLAALIRELPDDERIVVIEEARELAPPHPHLITLQTRGANTEARGGIDLADLVRAALRMRPDRLILGEARGAEIRDVLAALNTGHAGCWFTLHANTPADVPARLLALAALAGLSESALSAQAGAALDAIVHLERTGGQRHVAQIAALTRREGHLVVEPALSRRGSEIDVGPGAAHLGLGP